MSRSIRRAVLAVGLLAAGTIAGAVTAPAANADADADTFGHARIAVSGDFPDPGFAKFGKRYFLYRTGGNFGVTSSGSPASGYGSVRSSLKSIPSWVSKTSPKLWAPDVFATTDGVGRTFYVMYYTGIYAKTGVHCVGVAKSYSPISGFVDSTNKPVVCGTKPGYEAIDPSHYLAKDGKRYLLYKSDYGNAKDFDIRALPMDPGTGTVAVGSSRSKIFQSTAKTEAPSAIAHGGKVWLFTSRGDYIDCSYSTDVWSASSLWDGKFTRVRTVIARSAAKGQCGPGGATVIQDGATTRIAFHAYQDYNHNGLKDSSVRQTWVGVLKWNAKGQPYLY